MFELPVDLCDLLDLWLSGCWLDVCWLLGCLVWLFGDLVVCWLAVVV